MVGGVVGADAVAQLLGGDHGSKAHGVEIGQFDMSAVMPLVEPKGAGCKLVEKFVVSHGLDSFLPREHNGRNG